MEQNERILVDEFDNLQKIKKEIDIKIEKARKEIIVLTQQKNKKFLSGTHKTCYVKEFEKVVYPENKEFLIQLIKEKKLYEQFSSLNYSRLSSCIIKGGIDKEVLDLVKKEKSFRVSLIDRGI